MFKCVIMEELIVAGWHSIVKVVEIKQVLHTPGGGPLLIAEVGFSVAIQQMLSMRVAALSVHVQEAAGDGGAKAWGYVSQALGNMSVRLIAGELRDESVTIMQSLRTRLAVRACAVEPFANQENGTHWLASSAMLIAGPVHHVTLLTTRGDGA